MKIFNTTFSNLFKESLVRFGYQTITLQYDIEKYFEEKPNYTKLKNNFNILTGFAFKSEDYENDGIPLYRITNISTNDKDFVYINEDFKNDYSKYFLKESDITIGLTGDGRIKVDLITENNKFLLNQRVGALRIKNNNVNIKFYYYLLKCSSIIAKQFLYKSNGKTQLNISPNDLLNLKIPLIPLSIQNSTIEKIIPIENRIKELKEQIIDQKLIINEVFSREFGFDMEEFESIKKKEKIYFIDFYSFSTNKDLRNSVKFNKKSYKYLINFLKEKKFKNLKNYVDEPITLGSSISQNDIEENGEYYYISMAELKNYKIDLENAKKIKYSFFNTKKEKSIKYNDIIIARSGEGTIGKCAIIEDEDIEGINADFTIKVRINKNVYNSKFAYYYFCSFIFQYMIEINKKGLGNNTNIFPSQIQDFLIPDIPLFHQQKIVNEIKEKIDKQNEIKKLIDMERQKIDDLIEDVLK